MLAASRRREFGREGLLELDEGVGVSRRGHHFGDMGSLKLFQGWDSRLMLLRLSKDLILSNDLAYATHHSGLHFHINSYFSPKLINSFGPISSSMPLILYIKGSQKFKTMGNN